MFHLFTIWMWTLCVVVPVCGGGNPVQRCVTSKSYYSETLCERDRELTLDMISRTHAITAGFTSCESVPDYGRS